ncbi:hypothetical protein ACTWQL_06840 [Pseudalkalibacillus sp. R45]
MPCEEIIQVVGTLILQDKELRQRYIARRKCDFHFRGVSHLALQSTCTR